MNRLLLALLLLAAPAAAAEPAPEVDPATSAAPVAPPQLVVPPGAEAGADFDVERATQAWVDTLSPEQRAKSDAYFEGGYVLDAVSFLYGLAVAALFLLTPLSRRMRALADRVAGGRFLRASIYAAQYIVLFTVFTFPLTYYEGFHREHAYGMATHTLGSWLGDEAKGLAIAVVFWSLFLGVLYLILHKAPRTWWLWGTVVSVAFVAFSAMVSPVFIAPLFNSYKSVPEGPVRQQILSLARANGIPADDVYWFDASRQTKRISANVSGLAGTTRISLNDNLMNRSPAESIEAVMGHEMGHYVLNHVYKGLIGLGLILLAGFAFTAWAFDRVATRWRERLGVAGIADPAGLPLLGAVVMVWFFLMTPATNSLIRINEAEADMFGINASRQPDGFAHVAMQLSEYRKIHPGYWEEILFFDHPSGWNRVRMAMQWKKENPGHSAFSSKD